MKEPKIGTIMVEHDGITEPAQFPVGGQTFALASAAQDFCEAVLAKVTELGPGAEVHDGEVFVGGRHYYFKQTGEESER
jgi:hypothetical protein